MIRPCVKCGGEQAINLVNKHVLVKCSCCGHVANKLEEVTIILDKEVMDRFCELCEVEE